MHKDMANVPSGHLVRVTTDDREHQLWVSRGEAVKRYKGRMDCCGAVQEIEARGIGNPKP